MYCPSIIESYIQKNDQQNISEIYQNDIEMKQKIKKLAKKITFQTTFDDITKPEKSQNEQNQQQATSNINENKNQRNLLQTDKKDEQIRESKNPWARINDKIERERYNKSNQNKSLQKQTAYVPTTKQNVALEIINLSYKKQLEVQFENQYESIESITQDQTLIVMKNEVILYDEMKPIIREQIDLNSDYCIQQCQKIPASNTMVKTFHNLKNKKLYIMLLDQEKKYIKFLFIEEVYSFISYISRTCNQFLIVVVNIDKVNIGFFQIDDKQQQNLEPVLVKKYAESIESISKTEKCIVINHGQQIVIEELGVLCQEIQNLTHKANHNDLKIVNNQELNEVDKKNQKDKIKKLKRIELTDYSSDDDTVTSCNQIGSSPNSNSNQQLENFSKTKSRDKEEQDVEQVKEISQNSNTVQFDKKNQEMVCQQKNKKPRANKQKDQSSVDSQNKKVPQKRKRISKQSKNKTKRGRTRNLKASNKVVNNTKKNQKSASINEQKTTQVQQNNEQIQIVIEDDSDDDSNLSEDIFPTTLDYINDVQTPEKLQEQQIEIDDEFFPSSPTTKDADEIQQPQKQSSDQKNKLQSSNKKKQQPRKTNIISKLSNNQKGIKNDKNLQQNKEQKESEQSNTQKTSKIKPTNKINKLRNKQNRKQVKKLDLLYQDYQNQQQIDEAQNNLSLSVIEQEQQESEQNRSFEQENQQTTNSETKKDQIIYLIEDDSLSTSLEEIENPFSDNILQQSQSTSMISPCKQSTTKLQDSQKELNLTAFDPHIEEIQKINNNIINEDNMDVQQTKQESHKISKQVTYDKENDQYQESNHIIQEGNLEKIQGLYPKQSSHENVINDNIQYILVKQEEFEMNQNKDLIIQGNHENNKNQFYNFLNHEQLENEFKQKYHQMFDFQSIKNLRTFENLNEIIKQTDQSQTLQEYPKSNLMYHKEEPNQNEITIESEDTIDIQNKLECENNIYRDFVTQQPKKIGKNNFDEFHKQSKDQSNTMSNIRKEDMNKSYFDEITSQMNLNRDDFLKQYILSNLNYFNQIYQQQNDQSFIYNNNNSNSNSSQDLFNLYDIQQQLPLNNLDISNINNNYGYIGMNQSIEEQLQYQKLLIEINQAKYNYLQQQLLYQRLYNQ